MLAAINMLDETQKILNKYYQHNNDLFEGAAKDFKPTYASYGHFDEIDRIYVSMASLREIIRGKEFRGNYEVEYVTPKQILNDIDHLKKYVDAEVEELSGYVKKYQDFRERLPDPIDMTLKYTLDLQETLNYVLNFNEVLDIRNPGRTERLASQVTQLEAQFKYDRQIKSANTYFTFYIVLAIGIILSIIYLNGKGKNYAWTPALLALIPIIDSWISKDRLPKSIKLIFSKRYREKTLENITEEIRKNNSS